MPAPTYGPARSTRIELRCSAEERDAYATAALADGRTLTAWILRVLGERIQHDSSGPAKSTGAGKKVRRRS